MAERKAITGRILDIREKGAEKRALDGIHLQATQCFIERIIKVMHWPARCNFYPRKSKPYPSGPTHVATFKALCSHNLMSLPRRADRNPLHNNKVFIRQYELFLHVPIMRYNMCKELRVCVGINRSLCANSFDCIAGPRKQPCDL